MRIIKLNAIDSTNTYLRKLGNDVPLEDYTTVVAKFQTHGRGQRGTIWSSESSKNLTFSVFKDVSEMHIDHTFYISVATSLALVMALKSMSISKLSIKWPNDILSENKKICGILIENVIKQNTLKGSIIGIGLNVNQTNFEGLPQASSLKLLMGKTYHLDEVLHGVMNQLKHYFTILMQNGHDVLMKEYETHLFRRDKPSTFQDAYGMVFSGFIKRVSSSGNLQVLLEDEVTKEFGLKDITLLY